MALQFLNLPAEVLHFILLNLDTHDLLSISRTCHALRTLSLDPVLHAQRLKCASNSLGYLLTQRPARSAISPPNAWIWLNRTNVLSRSISRSLVRIRLGHSLERRPNREHLVERAILPEVCTKRDISTSIVCQQYEIKKSQLKDRLGRKLQRRPDVRHVVDMGIIPQECVAMDANGRRHYVSVSPRLVEVRRRVIRESLKDGLRAWVERRGWREQKRREGEWEDDGQGVRSVKMLVRKMSARMSREANPYDLDRVTMEKQTAQARWGREVEETRRREASRRLAFGNTLVDVNQPSRGHVLSLKRFWEGVIKSAAG